MKVLVVGGTGVFGSRVATLLLRDGHEVWIASRNEGEAAACAARLGARSIVVDRAGNLDSILSVKPAILVDAAGPYQHYGADPYRVPRFCIANGIDYLDLADDAGFVSGISVLDAEARNTGRFALSGASSVPGLSSAAVAALVADLDEVKLIETAIMPGNRAPRGRSVIASILSQVGGPMEIWRAGRPREARCWSEPKRYTLAPGLSRPAWLIGAPDIALFPARFRARSVMFRAGVELPILNAAVTVLAWLRKIGLIQSALPFTGAALRLSSMLLPFGADRGGMVVEVLGIRGRESISKSWTLVADSGDGPLVPAVIVRALLRRIATVAPGARACLAEVSLEEAEAAMSDLAVTTTRREKPAPPLFRASLGDAWADLPAAVQRLHTIHDIDSFSGLATVQRGRGWRAHLAARLFGFPPEATSVPITVTITRTDGGETWERNFDGRKFQSRLSAADKERHFIERFGQFAFEIELQVVRGSLLFIVRRGWFCGVPLPARLLPISDAREFEDEDGFHFDVGLSAPMGVGLVVRYSGVLKPSRES